LRSRERTLAQRPIIRREAFPVGVASHWLEPASPPSPWFLVCLQDPVFTPRCDSAVVNLVERERVVRPDCGMGDAHFRHDGAPLRNDTEHFDRPAFRIAAVEIHEIRAASDPDLIVRPFEDEVIREQLPYADPVPRLNSAPKLGDNFARFHGPIIRPQGTFPNAGPAEASLRATRDSAALPEKPVTRRRTPSTCERRPRRCSRQDQGRMRRSSSRCTRDGHQEDRCLSRHGPLRHRASA